MSKITKKEVLDLIEDKNLSENLIINNVDEDSMKELESKISNKENEGHFLFDFPLDEVNFVEQVIDNSIIEVISDYELNPKNLSQIEEEIKYLKDKLKSECNKYLIVASKNRIQSLEEEYKRKEQDIKRSESELSLTKYLLACTISEEYLLGKILEKYSKQEGMIERLGIEFNKSKLEHFRNFLNGNFDLEEFKKSYGENGTFSLLDRSITNLSFDNKVINWFLNFQNISNPELNKIINNIMTMEMKNSKFVVLTSGDNMVSYRFRDSFDNVYHYMEEGLGEDYREFSLIRK